MDRKVELGQFFTKDDCWLLPQVRKFIENSNCNICYDPFAGKGDIFDVVKLIPQFNEFVGLDIDDTLNWQKNDSLLKIPHIDNAIIVTNPPYLAKNSATRRSIDYSIYFNSSTYEDLYLIALDRMLEAQNYVIAIIPESFLNSSYMKKNKLSSVTIVEDNPFQDTEVPICVACFNSVNKTFSAIPIYKGCSYVCNYQELLNLRIYPKNEIKINFNDKSGWLGLQAIDGINDDCKIKFDLKDNIKYDWEKINISSRSYTLINVNVISPKRINFINNCNLILNELRNLSYDLLLTPFKGNCKNGVRRRRLDFNLARAIMEKAHIMVNENKDEQLKLF